MRYWHARLERRKNITAIEILNTEIELTLLLCANIVSVQNTLALRQTCGKLSGLQTESGLVWKYQKCKAKPLNLK